MAKNGYIGVEGAAKKIGKYFVGVDGKARKVAKAYVGDALGKARLFFEAHTHSFDSYLNRVYDDSRHWSVYQCACGETENRDYGSHYSYTSTRYSNLSATIHLKYTNCICGRRYSSSTVSHSFTSTGTIAGSDTSGHWYNMKCVCGRTGTSESFAHSDWKEEIVASATCSSNGKKKLTCGVCGYSKSEIIPKNGSHKWSAMIGGARHCLLCGISESFDIM